jgi:hypothetical protein
LEGTTREGIISLNIGGSMFTDISWEDLEAIAEDYRDAMGLTDTEFGWWYAPYLQEPKSSPKSCYE